MSAELLTQRLDRLELLLSSLVERQTVKDFYTTAEVGDLLGRSDYTVREWCRKDQVPAQKTPNGRGWLIANADLLRLRNGELPVPEHRVHRVLHRARK